MDDAPGTRIQANVANGRACSKPLIRVMPTRTPTAISQIAMMSAIDLLIHAIRVAKLRSISGHTVTRRLDSESVVIDSTLSHCWRYHAWCFHSTGCITSKRYPARKVDVFAAS